MKIKSELELWISDIYICSLMVSLLCITYYSLFDVQFNWSFLSTWDDDGNFINNTIFRKIDYIHLKEMWYAKVINVWEPLSWFIKALIYSLFGLNSRAYRVFSLVFHIINSIIYYFILKWLIMKLINKNIINLLSANIKEFISIISLFGTCFFALHPLQVEVIGWPSATSYTSCGFFYLLSILCYIFTIDINDTYNNNTNNTNDIDNNNEDMDSVHLKNNDDHHQQEQINKNKKQIWVLSFFSYIFYACSVLCKCVSFTLPIAILAIDMIKWTYDNNNSVSMTTTTTTFTKKKNKNKNHNNMIITFVQILKNDIYAIINYGIYHLGYGLILFLSIYSTLEANEKALDPVNDLLMISSLQQLLKPFLTIQWAIISFILPINLRAHYQLKEYTMELPTSFTSIFTSFSHNIDDTSVGNDINMLPLDNLGLDNLGIDSGIISEEVLIGFSCTVTSIVITTTLLIYYYYDRCRHNYNNYNNNDMTALTVISTKYNYFYNEMLHIIALVVFFLVTILPMSGVISHGMIALGGDRYMYLPMMGLCCIPSYCLLKISEQYIFNSPTSNSLTANNTVEGSNALYNDGNTMHRNKNNYKNKNNNSISNSISNSNSYKNKSTHDKSKDNNKYSDKNYYKNNDSTIDRKDMISFSMFKFLLFIFTSPLICTLMMISRRQILTWRNETTLWSRVMLVDPSDWRALDIWSEIIMRDAGAAGKKKAIEMIPLVERYAPKRGIKAQFLQAKFLLLKDEIASACRLYESMYIKNNPIDTTAYGYFNHPDNSNSDNSGNSNRVELTNIHSNSDSSIPDNCAALLNNLAVCALYDRTRGASVAVPLFTRGLSLNGVIDSQRKSLQNNLDELNRQKMLRNGGINPETGLYTGSHSFVI